MELDSTRDKNWRAIPKKSTQVQIGLIENLPNLQVADKNHPRGKKKTNIKCFPHLQGCNVELGKNSREVTRAKPTSFWPETVDTII